MSRLKNKELVAIEGQITLVKSMLSTATGKQKQIFNSKLDELEAEKERIQKESFLGVPIYSDSTMLEQNAANINFSYLPFRAGMKECIIRFGFPETTRYLNQIIAGEIIQEFLNSPASFEAVKNRVMAAGLEDYKERLITLNKTDGAHKTDAIAITRRLIKMCGGDDVEQ